MTEGNYQRLLDEPRWRRIAVVLLAASFLFNSLAVILSPRASASLRDIGSDHYSHYEAGILFWYRGFAIYDTPPDRLCARAPNSGYTIPELGERPPLKINWGQCPLPYPPLVYALHAPESLARFHGWFSFRTLNVLTILSYLLATHALLWVVARRLLLRPAPGDPLPSWALALPLPILYVDWMRFALIGFYDALPVLCGVLCLAALYERRDPPLAFLWYALAAGLHFRALWLLPFGVAAIVLCLRDGRLRAARDRALVAAGALIAAPSGYAFLRLAPHLHDWPPANCAAFNVLGQARWWVWAALACGIAAVAALALLRRWALAGALAFQHFFIFSSVQAMSWHVMFLAPLLVVPAMEKWPRRLMAWATLGLMVVYIVQRRWIWGFPDILAYFPNLLADARLALGR